MNIFALDEDPEKAAKMLCDRHLNKMQLESAQILCSVAYRHGYDNSLIPYKNTHKNHPSTLWAGDCYENWLWLVEHVLAMSKEKIARTGKGNKAIDVVKKLYELNFSPKNKNGEHTPFYLAMPDKYKTTDKIQSYRNYYLGAKQFFKDGKRPTWKNSSPPDWWVYAGTAAPK